MMPDQPRAVPSIPLFAGHVESKAAEVLNVLIFAHGGGDAPMHAEQLIPIRASLTSLVDCLFPIKGDYADFAGADSLDGIDYIHPTRVAALAVVIGRELGMPRSELINVAQAASLMNVGYLALRRSLLDQPRRLLEGEWEEHIHTHPDRGVKLLARSGLADDCLRAIEQHHERWDGSGYPAGLRGDGISRHARIIAVADTYVSLRSIRPHRPPVDAEVAIEEIAAGRGKLFDPDVVDAFEDVIARFTGIMRPSRAAVGATSITAAADSEHVDAQGHGRDTLEAAATNKPADLANDAAVAAPRSKRRRVTRAPAEDGAGRLAGDRRATSAPAPVRLVEANPVSPTPLPSSAVTAEATANSAKPKRSRRGRARRSRRNGSLFAPVRYVDASVNGRWSSDGLKR